MVTAGTLHKSPLFDTGEKRTVLQDALLRTLHEFDLSVQAWAVLSNHYHVVVAGSANPQALRKAIAKAHGVSARALNSLDGASGRTVWFQHWDTALTHRTSYLARLHYVHENPVRHGVVSRAVDYEWCSAGWLEQRADAAYRKLVRSFKIDVVNVFDAF